MNTMRMAFDRFTRKEARLVISGLVVVALVAWRFLGAPPTAATLEGPVVSVADGDTLTILVDRVQVRVRLEGIDAPERGQDHSRAAKEALAALTFGQPAQVVSSGKDRYGRVLGEVFVGEGRESVNQRLVRDGWAWHYTRYSRSRQLAELEREARAARRGLWSGPRPVPPWEWRARKRN